MQFLRGFGNSASFKKAKPRRVEGVETSGWLGTTRSFFFISGVKKSIKETTQKNGNKKKHYYVAGRKAEMWPLTHKPKKKNPNRWSRRRGGGNLSFGSNKKKL